MENLEVGCLSWNRSDWVGSYYPEDMPEEWWLDYYSNTYRLVLVPQNEWSLWSRDQIEDIVDSVEDFVFYFEFKGEPSDALLTKFRESILDSGLANVSGGVVVFSEQPCTDVGKYKLPVTLVSRAEKLSGWQWQNDGWICSGNPCGLIAHLTTDAKQQTELLKSFMQSLPEDSSGAALLICSEEIDMNQVNNLKVIGELLGY